jgi:biopolymer transport protein TolQ
VALFLNAGIVVKLIMILLAVFSVVSWGIILFKFIQVQRANNESRRFMDLFWKSKSFDAVASQIDRFSNSPLSILFNEAYAELKKVVEGASKNGERDLLSTELGGIENVSRALHRATNSETTRLERYLTFLATVGSTSPFIGLFGTVWGIMTAFEGIGKTGSASLAVVAPGIAEALVATAIGLVAAIPAVMAYNSFQHKVRVLSNDMDNFSSEFLNIVQRNIAGK